MMCEKTREEYIDDFVTGAALIQAATDGLIEIEYGDRKQDVDSWVILSKCNRFRAHLLRETLNLAADLYLIKKGL